MAELGNEEIHALAEAIKDQNLWAYGTKDFRGQLAQGIDALKKHFKDSGGGDLFVTPTASGTSSIQVALGGLQIPAGSEVIVTPITDPGTVTPIIFHNSIPVFADVSRASGQITPETVEAAVNHRTSAVIVVHLTGSPADVPGIRKRLDDLGYSHVKIIEDVAQGLGATLDGKPLGTLGDVGCFSLNPQKHITAGEGGFVLVRNETDFLRCLNFADKHRNRFKSDDEQHKRYRGPGHSFRMSQLQGAMLVAQVPRLASIADRRHAFGTALDAEFAAQTTHITPQSHLDKSKPTFFGYMFTIEREMAYDDKKKLTAEINANLSDLKIKLGDSSYTHRDLPIYQYKLFQDRNFSHNGRLWPAEVFAALIHKDVVLNRDNEFYDYTTVNCPEAVSYLKRSYWLRGRETHSPTIAGEVVKRIVQGFQDAKVF